MKVAIFASATDSYVPKAITALLSFRRWHKEFGYYILGTKAHMRSDTLQLLERHAFELIDMDESKRFMRKRSFESKFPLETVYLLKGPELMAERGFEFSISIDGDTFAYRPLQLETILPSVGGLAGRPVRSLSRTLTSKQAENNSEFDFSLSALKSQIGLEATDLATGLEINGGFVIWNNQAMVKASLFDNCVSITEKCKGCFEGNQDLLAFVAAVKHIPITLLDYSYHFLLAQPNKNKRTNTENPLRLDASREYFGEVRVVHFIRPKPWLATSADRLSASQAHFINAWRDFVKHGLGADAGAFFGELSSVGKNNNPLEWALRMHSKIVSFVASLVGLVVCATELWCKRGQKAWVAIRGEPMSRWARTFAQLWLNRKA